MQSDDETMAERIQADEIREPEPAHHPGVPTSRLLAERIESDKIHEPGAEPGHQRGATSDVLAERIESDKVREPSDTSGSTETGRHAQAEAEAHEPLAARIESDRIDE